MGRPSDSQISQSMAVMVRGLASRGAIQPREEPNLRVDAPLPGVADPDPRRAKAPTETGCGRPQPALMPEPGTSSPPDPTVPEASWRRFQTALMHRRHRRRYPEDSRRAGGSRLPGRSMGKAVPDLAPVDSAPHGPARARPPTRGFLPLPDAMLWPDRSSMVGRRGLPGMRSASNPIPAGSLSPRFLRPHRSAVGRGRFCGYHQD